MTGLVAATVIAAVVLAACGNGNDRADDSGTGPRTVEIDMVDIAFEPDAIEVAEGETVRFVFTNTGEVAHDAFIGDHAAQVDHETEMSESDDDGQRGGHGDEADDAVTVAPRDTGQLTYTFDEAGSLEIGCHQPGHYDAGMTVDVAVGERTSPSTPRSDR